MEFANLSMIDRVRGNRLASKCLVGGVLLGLCSSVLVSSEAIAGAPDQLLRGEAPVLFVQGGERDGVLLRDGTTFARPDDIILYVPQVVGGHVDVGQTGQFFHVWDSGPVAGPNGNDDNRNELRGLHFEPSTSSFLVSYDDSTITGFDFGSFKDGDMMRVSATSVNNGFIDDVALDRVFNEGTPGSGTATDPVLTTADIYGIGVSADNSLFWTSGSGAVLDENGTGTLSTSTTRLIHSEGFDLSGNAVANPRNIGPDVFYSGLLSGPNLGSIDAGQLRGVDELASGELTVSLAEGTDYYSDRINNGTIDFEGNGQILGLDPTTKLLDIIYDGDRFFSDATLGTTDGEIMGYDVLDSQDAVIALAELLGTDSPAGIALALFPEPSTIMLLCVGGMTALRRRKAIRR